MTDNFVDYHVMKYIVKFYSYLFLMFKAPLGLTNRACHHLKKLDNSNPSSSKKLIVDSRNQIVDCVYS